MKKKITSFAIASVLSLAFAATSFASPGTVERYVNFRSAPSTSSTVYSSLKPGTQVDVLEQVNKYWLKISVNGQVGYVSPSYLNYKTPSPTPAPSTNVGTVERYVNFRSAPSTSSTVYSSLKPGTQVQILEQVNAYWVKISVNGQVGYVSPAYLNFSSPAPAPAPAPAPVPAPAPQPAPSTTSTQSIADKIIAHAEALEGVTHYKYGANQPPTLLDCSSFTKYVFGLEGITLKWGTNYQKDAGTYVAKSNLQKGDLVFFTVGNSTSIGHVGIYIGNGQFIHNTPAADGVTVSSLTSGYWNTHYVTARRVLP